MTRRSLWQMADNEIFVLLGQAEHELEMLNLRYMTLLPHYELLEERVNALKERSPEYPRAKSQYFAAARILDECASRIAAQRTFVQSLRNEYQHRNPPFWTAQDLERMNRNRRRS